MARRRPFGPRRRPGGMGPHHPARPTGIAPARRRMVANIPRPGHVPGKHWPCRRQLSRQAHNLAPIAVTTEEVE